MKTRLPVLVLGLSALGACASTPPPSGDAIVGGYERHPIAVTQSAARIEIPVAPGEAALSPQSRAQVRAFASGYLQYGHGALVLSTPSGSANADAASMLAQQTRMSLVDAGVSYVAVAGSTYDAAGAPNAPIILSFTRFEAQAPECAPLWQQDLAHQSNNQPWASFGCSTQANLAAMIEDPADLIQPRNADPRDSNRRATVMEAYRAGEPTHATRSAEESATVSDAVQ